MDGFHGSAVPDGEMRAECIKVGTNGGSLKAKGLLCIVDDGV
jgi:hypothetical protein